MQQKLVFFNYCTSYGALQLGKYLMSLITLAMCQRLGGLFAFVLKPKEGR